MEISKKYHTPKQEYAMAKKVPVEKCPQSISLLAQQEINNSL